MHLVVRGLVGTECRPGSYCAKRNGGEVRIACFVGTTANSGSSRKKMS